MPTLFIARSHSTLHWLRDLPHGWHVVIHDSQGDLQADRLPVEAHVLPTRLAGGLPAAYLQYMASAAITDAHDVTVFCPDEPVAHSPDFFELMEVPHLWGDLQPLSTIGAIERSVPPAGVLMHDRRDEVADLGVRAERFSLHTLLPVAYFDAQTHRRAESYRQHHELPEGASLAAHFLAACGLTAMAQQARTADVGVMAHGHLFAVRNNRLLHVQRRFGRELAGMIAHAQATNGQEMLFEHLWLHLLGESFIRFESNERPDERTEPVDRAMARVVASIDAVLSQSTGQPAARTPAPTEALQRSVDTLREQARTAAAAGQPDEAQRLLQQALLRQPGHVGVLTDAAGLAWQTGDLERAVLHARDGLRLDLKASTCAYVLGMALARRNERVEAQGWLRAITEDPSHQLFRHQRPDLMEAAARELERLSLLPGAVHHAAAQPEGRAAA